MSEGDDLLIESTHQKILIDKILTDPNFVLSSEQVRPKAIILAGQPGAGKGGLGRRASIELDNNAVTVDPDALRNFHPKVEDFRRENPYTWSGRTHADASQWADELREATIASKKNLIFDTTLTNGPWSAEMIKDLQVKGYDVEIRVLASPKLESELGVDKRFADTLNIDGYGRHVPEGARDAIYDKIPSSLNTIHAQNDVPIRIFNREGIELYDSRTNAALPGTALEQARELRLKDPSITRGLRDGYNEQQAWHRELPENLRHNPKVDASTRDNLLTERGDRKVVESLDRAAREAIEVDHLTRVRPAGIRAGAALGIVGLALDAYDAAETVRTATRLHGEGNDTAAQSELIHFGSRTVGGMAGAGLGFTGGVVVGVETGPGLFVTGAIGAGFGVFGGGKFAEWTDNRRIYNQEDRQGNTWSFDPEQPALSWQRKATIDSSDDNIDNARRGALRASPALANELNFQSSSISVELVLGGPPAQHDPFMQPAKAGDSPSVSTANWERDVESGQWHRNVVLAFAERGLSPKRMEVASEERAMELDRAAAQTVLQNAGNSPAAIATRYEDAYVRNGWAAYGEMPLAVRDARTDVNTLIASDENRYERRADGQWVSTGLIYNSTANGNLRDELEITREILQTKLPPPQAIQAPAPMTAENRLRDTVIGAYANAGVSPNAERIEASTLAVRETWMASGLDANTTALQLQRGAAGLYGQDSPIASLRLEADGKTYVIAATTSTEDIKHAQAARLNLAAPAIDKEPGNWDADTPKSVRPSPAIIPATSPSASLDPRDRNHPDHALYQQALAGVHQHDAALGRTPDEKSERMAASLTALAKENGMRQIDHVAFSVNNGRDVKAGENVFVVQGEMGSSTADRAHMKTDVAVNTSVQNSFQQLESINQKQAQEVLAQQQSRQQTAQQASDSYHVRAMS